MKNNKYTSLNFVIISGFAPFYYLLNNWEVVLHDSKRLTAVVIGLFCYSIVLGFALYGIFKNKKTIS